MSPTLEPWTPTHPVVPVRHVGSDDGGNDDALGHAHGASLPAYRRSRPMPPDTALPRRAGSSADTWWRGRCLPPWPRWRSGRWNPLALLTPMMDSASDRFGGAVLLVAGVYQWLPLKDACLSRCRAPLSFVQQHGGFQQGARGSLRPGLLHGLYCIGCCWALMALLFVGGVMNLLWIAALMMLVLAGEGPARRALVHAHCRPDRHCSRSLADPVRLI